MKLLRITVVTSMERNTALSSAKQVVSGCGGWIVNHSLFSNIAANINFELPLTMIEKLVENLAAAGLSPNIEGDLPEGKAGDVHGCLSLSFLHDNPDLKREVPPFG